MERILIVTGKGGVGKTTVAAAHAVSAARSGKKTLLVSIDMAHSIGDLFDISIGKNIAAVSDNLWAVELDPYALMREEFPETQRSIFDLVGTTGKSISSVSEHFMLPGFENLFALLKIKKLYESGLYDCIVIDCGPTGETLSLLQLPELLAWYMEKFFPVGKAMIRVLSPISRLKYHIKLPSRKTTNKVEVLHAQLLNLQYLLKNKDISTIRLVCIPEKMAVEETKRNFMYMNLYGYQVDTLFINRILPDSLQNPFLETIKQQQSRYIQEIEQVFTAIPMVSIPWYSDEVRGRCAIQKLCDDVLSIPDLLAVRAHTEQETYTKWDEGYSLTVTVPNTDCSKVTVACHAQDVTVKVNNFNRCIPLPNTLYGSEIADVVVDDTKATIYFRLKKTQEP